MNKGPRPIRSETVKAIRSASKRQDIMLERIAMALEHIAKSLHFLTFNERILPKGIETRTDADEYAREIRRRDALIDALDALDAAKGGGST